MSTLGRLHALGLMEKLIRRPYRRARRRITGQQSAPRRRYIPHHLGVEGFFMALRNRNVRHAVLRWFDGLPTVAPGEDIDLLIHDDDVARVSDLLDSSAGVPCDIYSASGSGYHGMPYLPPHSANRLLQRAERLRGLYGVPCAEDHFLSLAYHALYHKGPRSGLPTSCPGLCPTAEPEHDYASVLAGLAAELGITVDIDMESLDRHLADHGWQPTPEMRARLAKRNPWVLARSERAAHAQAEEAMQPREVR